MDQKGKLNEDASARGGVAARPSLLPIVVSAAVLISGLNALVQVLKTLAELSGLVLVTRSVPAATAAAGSRTGQEADARAGSAAARRRAA